MAKKQNLNIVNIDSELTELLEKDLSNYLRTHKGATKQDWVNAYNGLHKSLQNAIKAGKQLASFIMGGEDSPLPFGLGLVDIATGAGAIDDITRSFTKLQLAKRTLESYAQRSVTPKASKFLSNLDWSPDYWFKTLGGRDSYTERLEYRLSTHISEYTKIEEDAIKNGDLIFDKSGNLIVKDSPNMSPLEWIVRHSEAMQPWNNERIATGVSKDYRKNFESNPKDVVTWGTIDNPSLVEEYASTKLGGKAPLTLEDINDNLRVKRENIEELRNRINEAESLGKDYIVQDNILQELNTARERLSRRENNLHRWETEIEPLHGGKVYEVVTPKGVKQSPILDAAGSKWDDIPYSDSPSGFTSTDHYVNSQRLLGYDVTNINNVMDTYNGELLNEKIIHNGVPRKSVLGNSGDLDIRYPGLFDSWAAPLVVGSGITAYELKANGGLLFSSRQSIKPYNELSLREKALIIKTGVKNGLRSLEEIEKEYNSFANGGSKKNSEDDLKIQDLTPEELKALVYVDNNRQTSVKDDIENAIKASRGELNHINHIYGNYNYYLNNNLYSVDKPVLDKIAFRGKELPEVTIDYSTHPALGRIDTWRPLSTEYPFTGHSIVKLPNFKSENYRPYTATFNTQGYNLVTNNCSDFSLEPLLYMANKNKDSILFNTPGDTRDFVKNNYNTTDITNLLHNKLGHSTLVFDIPLEQLLRLHDYQVLKDKNTSLLIKGIDAITGESTKTIMANGGGLTSPFSHLLDRPPVLYGDGGDKNNFEVGRRSIPQPSLKGTLLNSAIGAIKTPGIPILGAVSGLVQSAVDAGKRYLDTKDMDETQRALYDWKPTTIGLREFRDRALADPEAFKNYYRNYPTKIKQGDFEGLYNTGKTFYDDNSYASKKTNYEIGNEILRGLNDFGGLSNNQKSAILANAYIESLGWNAGSQYGGPAKGYFMMEDTLRKAYNKWLKENNYKNSPYYEALYVAQLMKDKALKTGWDMVDEATREKVNSYTSEKEAKSPQGRSLFNHRGYTTEQAYNDWDSDDLEKAVFAFESLFERAGRPHMDRRLGVAKYLSDDVNLNR